MSHREEPREHGALEVPQNRIFCRHLNVHVSTDTFGKPNPAFPPRFDLWRNAQASNPRWQDNGGSQGYEALLLESDHFVLVGLALLRLSLKRGDSGTPADG